MKFNDFISHIKHNSLYIHVFTGARIDFLGTVGEYKTAILKRKIGDRKIYKIEPLTNSLNIFLEEEKIWIR